MLQTGHPARRPWTIHTIAAVPGRPQAPRVGLFIVGSLVGAFFGVFVMSVLAARGYDRGFEDALAASRLVSHARAMRDAHVPRDATVAHLDDAVGQRQRLAVVRDEEDAAVPSGLA